MTTATNRALTLLFTGGIFLLASRSSAEEPLRARYFGASIALAKGGAYGPAPLDTMGFDAFVGVRLAPWISVEAFFAAQFATSRVPEPGAGAFCAGRGADLHRWEEGGARVWFHLLRMRELEVSIGPTVGVGVEFRDFAPYQDNPMVCDDLRPIAQTWSMFEAGVDFSLEVWPVPWLGARATTEASVAGPGWPGVAQIRVWLGPVFRL